MSKMLFQLPRRRFVSTSLRSLAGASLAALLPETLLSNEPAPGCDRVPEMFSTDYGSNLARSLFSARPSALGDQVLAGIPVPLRQYALEIRCTLVGIKPGCRLSLTVGQLKESLSYLRSLNCALAFEEPPHSVIPFGQLSPQRRRAFSSTPRVRVYLARTAADTKKLAELESGNVNYRALGLALGYPACCVDAAAEHDVAFFSEKHNEWRQANLNAEAVRVSTAVDFRCNHFLVESDLHTAAPLSAIAHYPCRLDCRESIAVAQAALEWCARTWPIWTITLCQLLRAPVLYWPDDYWAPEYWDEYCGLALVGAVRGREQWRSTLPALLLGTDRTPAGQLPHDVVRALVIRDRVLLQDSTGRVFGHPFESCGRPWLLDWRAGVIQQLA